MATKEWRSQNLERSRATQKRYRERHRERLKSIVKEQTKRRTERSLPIEYIVTVNGKETIYRLEEFEEKNEFKILSIFRKIYAEDILKGKKYSVERVKRSKFHVVPQEKE